MEKERLLAARESATVVTPARVEQEEGGTSAGAVLTEREPLGMLIESTPKAEKVAAAEAVVSAPMPMRKPKVMIHFMSDDL